MFEIYSETPYRMAREYHRTQLEKSQKNRMFHTVDSRTPKVWDHVALRLGNLLIRLGSGLKSHSAFSQLSKDHA